MGHNMAPADFMQERAAQLYCATNNIMSLPWLNYTVCIFSASIKLSKFRVLSIPVKPF